MIYSEKTKHQYQIPPCPNCGADARAEWVDVRRFEDPPDVARYLPGYRVCSARCGEGLGWFELYELSRRHLGWRFT